MLLICFIGYVSRMITSGEEERTVCFAIEYLLFCDCCLDELPLPLGTFGLT